MSCSTLQSLTAGSDGHCLAHQRGTNCWRADREPFRDLAHRQAVLVQLRRLGLFVMIERSSAGWESVPVSVSGDGRAVHFIPLGELPDAHPRAVLLQEVVHLRWAQEGLRFPQFADVGAPQIAASTRDRTRSPS